MHHTEQLSVSRSAHLHQATLWRRAQQSHQLFDATGMPDGAAVARVGGAVGDGRRSKAAQSLVVVLAISAAEGLQVTERRATMGVMAPVSATARLIDGLTQMSLRMCNAPILHLTSSVSSRLTRTSSPPTAHEKEDARVQEEREGSLSAYHREWRTGKCRC